MMSHLNGINDFTFNVFENLESSLQETLRIANNADWRVYKLQQFIDAHNGSLGDKLADVCRQLDLGITASHASRLFHNDLGVGMREYKKLRRLRTAAVRLQNTSMSVKEIASDLGYQTPADFFRQFKQFFQVTPLKFRSMSRAYMVMRRIVA